MRTESFMNPAMGRVVFVNQLRGISALLVVLTHYIVVFWGIRGLVSENTASPVQDGSPPFVFDLLVTEWFNPASLGVSLFFLISGFVVSLSVTRHKKLNFFAARMLRIYPTYISGLFIQIALVFASSLYWGKEFPWSVDRIFANSLLIHDFIGYQTIDLVNWTLVVELIFYVIVVSLKNHILNGKAYKFFSIGALSFVFSVIVKNGYTDQSMAVQLFCTYLMYCTYIYIGVLFGYHFRGVIEFRKLIASIFGIMLLFLGNWKFGVSSFDFNAFSMNYLYGLVIFSVLYGYREKFRSFPIADWLADISYPLYLVHSITGYIVMKYLMIAVHAPFWISMLSAMGVSFFIGTVVHSFVEKPAIDLGKKLMRSRDFASAAPEPSRPPPALQ